MFLAHSSPSNSRPFRRHGAALLLAPGLVLSPEAASELRPALPAVAFASESQSAVESAGTLSLSVVLSELSAVDVVVPFGVGGSATPRSDYSHGPSPLTIPAGQLAGQITIDLLDDALDELPETVVVTLHAPTGAVLGAPGVHTLTIEDDDPEPTVGFAKRREAVAESAGQVAVRVLLSEISGRDVLVPFGAWGDATAGEDYTLPAGPLVIPAGAGEGAILVEVIDDGLSTEGPEVLGLSLGSASGAAHGELTSFALLILDDDLPTYGPVRRGLALDAESLDLGWVRAGASSEGRHVTATNDGWWQTTFHGVALVGPGAAAFLVEYDQRPPVALLPGESTGFTIRFAPGAQSAPGAFAATARVRQQPAPIPVSSLMLAGHAFGPAGAELRLNAGGAAHLDGAGVLWSPDFAHSGASEIVGAIGEVHGTEEDELYLSARAGADFEYAFELPNGRYLLRLHFAEIAGASGQERRFDVHVEDALVLDDFGIAAQAGLSTAWVHDEVVELTDGRLDLRFAGVVGEALVAALELRSLPVVGLEPTLHDFGDVPQGEFAETTLRLVNSGLAPARLVGLGFLVSGGPGAAGHDFTVEVAGELFAGGEEDVLHALDVPLPGGAALDLLAGFAPSEHDESELVLRLEFEGVGSPLDALLRGLGTQASWGFLHPEIERSPALAVDHDQNGFELVRLDGSDSHTHEPGHELAGWTWRSGGQLLAETMVAELPFALGATEIELEIADDNDPPATAATHATIEVHAPDRVPGVLARYYDASGVGAAALLDAVPSVPQFAERRPTIGLPQDSKVGSSAFLADVLVRFTGALQAEQGGTFQFLTSGGGGHRVLVDGVLVQGPVALSAGEHALEVRWAVNGLAELPLALAVYVDGQPRADLLEALTHSELDVLPLIHTMPAGGNELGGNLVQITGFGFWPASELVVHWGELDLELDGLNGADASHIRLVAPPSPGPPGVVTEILVSVETPAGTSAAKPYVYSPDGDVPIQFALASEVLITGATSGAWGPDGRFWVSTRYGKLKAVTFDEDYQIVSAVTYNGVNGTDAETILGIAFNPFDPPGQTRVWIAHSELFAQGGGAFSGPSPFPGRISVVGGPSYDQAVPVITGLPTSNHDHGINGIEFTHDGDLLICVGGNTNAGVRHPNIGDLPESPLTAALLRADLSRPDFDGAIAYVDAQGQPVLDQVLGQAIDLAPGSHVRVLAAGLRNPYDLALTTWGEVWCTDNGPNNNFGPASTGPDTDAGSPHPQAKDELLVVRPGAYYGHPNRNRGRYDPRQNIYRGPSVPAIPGEFQQTLVQLDSSFDGICEYRSTTFGGQMRGNLLAAKQLHRVHRIVLSADRRSVELVESLSDSFKPLDVETGPGGAILAVSYDRNRLSALVPIDPSAVGPTVYDITPWRAPVGGGQTFVIGGRHFGTLGDTSVTIGGVPAPLVSVSSKRIVGTVPPGIAPSMQLVDVVVQVGGSQTTLTGGFLALPAAPGLAPGQWTSGTPGPDKLGEVAGGVIGSKLYLVGEGESTNVKTYAYDLASDFWVSNLPQRPYPGHHHSAEVIGGKLYLFGGLGAGEGRVQVFDPAQGAQGAWFLGADMPWPGGSIATALVDGLVYAAGGIVGSGTVANAAVYDPVLDIWSPLAPMPTKVNHAAAVAEGGRMWVFGGRQGGNQPQPGFRTVQVYDPATGAWDSSDLPGSQLAPMPSGRGGTGRAVRYGGELYVFGGETNDASDPEASTGRVFRQVFAYDPQANTWRQDAPLPTPRHGIWPIAYEGRIHVIAGGTKFGFSQSTVHEIFMRY